MRKGIMDDRDVERATQEISNDISSIYEKTETKTRLGLFQSYMNFTAE